MTRMFLALPLLTLAACGGGAQQAAADNAVTNTTVEDPSVEGAPPPGADNAIDAMAEGAPPTDRLAGRWTGVEGMYLVVTPAAETGRYTLEMQYGLDNSGTFEGWREGNGIAFERGGETLRLGPSDGEATGLRYLFGKEDCLTVVEGEGYCRD